MAIGRRFTDDKNEVLASAKISRVVLSKILKLFDFMRAISNMIFPMHAKYSRSD